MGGGSETHVSGRMTFAKEGTDAKVGELVLAIVAGAGRNSLGQLAHASLPR